MLATDRQIAGCKGACRDAETRNDVDEFAIRFVDGIGRKEEKK